MAGIRKTITSIGLIAVLVLSMSTAARAASCGGPWTGPNGTTCTFAATGGPLAFGGFAVAGSAAIGISVYSPPGVFAAQCAATGAGFATCNGPMSSVNIPPGQTVICDVKGLGTGFFTCVA